MNIHTNPCSHPQNQDHVIQTLTNKGEMENVFVLHLCLFEAFTWDNNFITAIHGEQKFLTNY